MRGKITKFDAGKRFGFIKPEGGGADVFFHANDVARATPGDNLVGLNVEFEVSQGEKGPRARRVRAIGDGDLPAARDAAESRPPRAPAPSSPEAGAATGWSQGRSLEPGTWRDALAWLPYDFVPVPTLADGSLGPATVLGEPIFHDGSGASHLLSGTLECEITALTPTLVGSDQIEIENSVEDATWRLPGDRSAKKKVIEPLFLPPRAAHEGPGRVVIGGASLKGMIRQNLGALFAAPMERVTEHSYSYRPNLAFGGNPALRDACPAIVQVGADGSVSVRVLPGARDACFVRTEAHAVLAAAGCMPGKPVAGTLNDVSLVHDDRTHRLNFSPGARTTLDHVLAKYRGGIDGKGILAALFSETGTTYHHVLVERARLAAATTLPVPPVVHEHYTLTQRHLASDDIGHLRKSHPLNNSANAEKIEAAKDAIEASSTLEDGQLVYVEVERASGPGSVPRVVSIGHHFRYRWRYADSVRLRCAVVGGARRTQLRPILSPHPHEGEQASSGAPVRLAGVRRLMGYVTDNRRKGSSLVSTRGIGGQGGAADKSDFERLAGRIAPNHAVEVVEADDTVQARFLAADRAFAVPLPILGSPRPSAAEFYLQQPSSPAGARDARDMQTYGDILGDDPGAELRGRKFYPHQKEATRDGWSPASSDPEHLKSEQTTVARYVSRPGRRFRFKVRFRHLEPQELGALIAALNPDELAARIGRKEGRPQAAEPSHAVKLGHGRPLGMGSVRIAIVGARLQQPDGSLSPAPELVEKVSVAFATLASGEPAREKACRQWLAIHDMKNAAERRQFPTKDGDIFTFHTELRRQHARDRRTRR